MSLEQTLIELADHLAAKAREPMTDIQDAVKIFKELREFYAILTKDDEKGDKSPGRRSTTILQMRRNIKAAEDIGGDDDAGDDPAA
jgi:hypothetical protein